MTTEIQSTVSTNPRPASGGAGISARPTISQTVEVGSLARASARPPIGGDDSGAAPSSAGTIERTVSQGGDTARKVTATLREKLDNLDRHGTITAPKDAPAEPGVAPPAAGTPSAAPVASAAPPATAAPAGATAATPATAATADEIARHRADNERLSGRNRELMAELERVKAGGTKREPSARDKALQGAEQLYFTGQSGAIDAVRTVLATWLGVDDPKHADVENELKGLYQDLTSHDLGVAVGKAEQASREAARTRQLLARDQRERKAEQEAARPPPDDPAAKLDADHTALIGARLTTRQADGKTIADAYPLTMAGAGNVHGMKPDELLLKVIREGFATGDLDHKMSDEALIEHALKTTETYYQALADKLDQARKPRTATPTVPDATAQKETGQSQAARTITSASASVAPATPPAKPETPTAKPKYRNEAERRKAIVDGHTTTTAR